MADISTALQLIITARDQASATLNRIASTAKESSHRAGEGFEKLREVGKRAMEGIEHAAERVKEGLHRHLIEPLSEAVHHVAHLLEVAGIAGGAVSALAAAFAPLEAIHKTAEIADELTRISQTSGVAVVDLQKLGIAAKHGFIDLDTLGFGLTRLSRAMLATQDSEEKLDNRIGAAAQKFKVIDPELEGVGRAFERLGVRVADANGHLRPTQDVLLDLSERFRAMPAGPERAALAMQIFGRSGAQMVPFLALGRREIQELGEAAEKNGLLMSGPQVRAARAFELAWHGVGNVMRGITQTMGSALMPVATRVASVITSGLQSLLNVVRANRDAITAFANRFVDFAGHGLLVIGRLAIQGVGFLLVKFGQLSAWISANRGAIVKFFADSAVMIVTMVERAIAFSEQVAEWINRNREFAKTLGIVAVVATALRSPLAAVAFVMGTIAAVINVIGVKLLSVIALALLLSRAFRVASEMAQALLHGKLISFTEAWKRGSESQMAALKSGFNDLMDPLRRAAPDLFASVPNSLAGIPRTGREGQIRGAVNSLFAGGRSGNSDYLLPTSEFDRRYGTSGGRGVMAFSGQGERITATLQGGFVTASYLQRALNDLMRQLSVGNI